MILDWSHTRSSSQTAKRRFAGVEPCIEVGRATRGEDLKAGRRDEVAMITLKRAYEAVSRTDGTRFLVERLWPRGISKATLRLDAWLKEVGPSTELRKWFSHDPDKWDEFRRRYFRELASQPEAWQPIVSAARRGRVTLVYSSQDRQHNNAVALQQFLRKKAHRPARSQRTSAAHRPRHSLR